MRCCLGERRAPLASTGLGRDVRDALGIGIVGLGKGGVQLVRAGRVVSLELVIDLRRGVERALEVVGTTERARPVDLVHLHDRSGNLEVARRVIEFLAAELVCKDWLDIVDRRDLAIRQPHRLGRFWHIGTQVVPGGRNLVFLQMNAVRIGLCCFCAHLVPLSSGNAVRLHTKKGLPVRNREPQMCMKTRPSSRRKFRSPCTPPCTQHALSAQSCIVGGCEHGLHPSCGR